MTGRIINVYIHECDSNGKDAKGNAKVDGDGGASCEFRWFDEKDRQKFDEDATAAQERYKAVGSRGGRLRSSFCESLMSSDKDMRACTGFSVCLFGLLSVAFAHEWEKAELAEMGRKGRCAKKRAGKRGPRPRAEIDADRENNIPLVYHDPVRGSAPGNRCDVEPIHVLLMTLMWEYRNPGQDMLAAQFGIDQSSVSRYLRVGRRLLEEILPTPKKIMEKLRDIDSPEMFAALFPKGTGDCGLVFDATHVRANRPVKSSDRDILISNKKKFPSFNTLGMSTLDGLIMAISDTYNGRAHDLTILRELLPQMGAFGKMLLGLLPDDSQKEAAGEEADPATAAEEASNDGRDCAVPAVKHPAAAPADRMPLAAHVNAAPAKEECALTTSGETASEQNGKASANQSAPVTKKKEPNQDQKESVTELSDRLLHPPKHMMQALLDSGFQGCKKDLLGADVHHPFKKPPNGELTAEQKAYNRELSKRRVIIENAFAAAKHFKRVSTTYNGSKKEFNHDFNIACGLANFRHMVRNGTLDHWSLILGLYFAARGR